MLQIEGSLKIYFLNFEILGLETEKDYEYEGDEEKCHFQKSKVKATITGGISIPKVPCFPNLKC